MKKVLLLLLFVVPCIMLGQEYEFKKAITNVMGIVKMQGNIILTDSLITIEMIKPSTGTTLYKIGKYVEKGDSKQYFSVDLSGIDPVETRLFFNTSPAYKKYPYQLSVETKDPFTNQIFQFIYILKEKTSI